MKKVLASLSLGLLTFNGIAQQDLIINSLPIIPQSNYTNPGAFKPYGGYFGLPLVSSVYTNFSNSGFSLVDIANRPGGKYGDSLVLGFESALGKMKNKEALNVNVAIDLLNFGFKVKKNFFMLSAREIINTRLSYSKDLFTLAWKGNGGLLGQSADLSNVALNATHYREYALGYSREFGEKLSIGIRAKYLYGMENIYMARNNSSFYTDPTSFALTAKSDFEINTSGLSKFDTISTDIPGYLFKRNNHGWGLDLGGEYKINEKFSVAASALDIGQIFWNDGTNKSYTSKETSFTFEGFDIGKIVNSPDSNLIKQLGDTLNKAFKISESSKSYTAPLNTRIYVGGTYRPFKKTTVGLTFFSGVGKNYFNPSGSVSITQRLGNILYLSANWSYLNHSAKNVGVGFAFNFGPFQLYTATDNLFAVIWPQSAKNVHVHIGFNVLIDYKKDKEGKTGKDELTQKSKNKKAGKDRDADGIEDMDDKCPDVPGYLKFNGCPDRDNDGVQDSEDQCPDTVGEFENRGCPWPDTDKDGLIDKEDNCPNQAGPKENKGCPWPDTDGDGVPDNTDKCPSIVGPPANNGCPYGDSDNDGINDDKDKCPDQPGPIDNQGCPYGDRDGDGVKDNADGCPDTPGPVANRGCPYPDTDNDGLTDDVDQCPKTPGPKENKGCPVIEKKAQEALDLAFSNLEFKTGTAIIGNESFLSLYKLADVLKTYPDYKLLISGHTDGQGVPAKNLELSKKRAEAVKTFLIGQGINASRLTAEWFGSTKPIADNSTPEGRDRNRRVEMKVVFE